MTQISQAPLPSVSRTCFSRYDFQKGYPGGTVKGYEFDYWKCVGFEFFTLWIAILNRGRRWSQFNSAMGTMYRPRTSRTADQRGYGFDNLSEHSDILIYDGKKRGRACVLADILKERYSAGSKVLPTFDEFVEVDLLCCLTAAVRRPRSFGFPHWRPWTTVYLGSHEPRFLRGAIAPKYARGVCAVVGVPNVEELKAAARGWLSKLGEPRRETAWFSHISNEIIDSWGSSK